LRNNRFRALNHFARRDAYQYAISIDPKGLVEWKSETALKSHVIEVLTEQVSDDFLAYLQSIAKRAWCVNACRCSAWRCASKGQCIAATCRVAREFDAPAGVKPIEWRLLTNRTASTAEEALELIARLERALALFLVVAWRVAYLMRLGRTCPDLDAHLFPDPDEIRAACLLTKTRAPAQPKRNEVLRLIARLGGFLGRKGDGEPGARTIWLGLREVHVAAETLRLLRDDDGDDTSV
jgi:hypothetical protein